MAAKSTLLLCETLKHSEDDDWSVEVEFPKARFHPS
jgi:hypothetical protein